ncbi:ABC transporter ATP-binding protein/permease [Candidatus Saccharibacteria bacterium]|nr:ABC transporter ATP-binding protein/permease [Candidatus Saccharibacteria bacterium]
MSEEKTQKKKANFKQTLVALLTYCKPWYPGIVIALVFAIGSAILQVVAPRQVERMTDYMINGLMGLNPDWYSGVVAVGVLLIVIYAVSFVLGYTQQFIMALISARLARRLRGDMSQKINKLPLAHLDKTPTGDTLSRITNDVDTVTRTFNWSAATIITAVTLMVGATIMMFITNWLMALTAIGAALIGFMLMGAIASKSQKYFVRQQAELGEVNGHIEEYFSGHSVIKVNNARGQSSERFDHFNEKLYTSAWKSQFYGSVLFPLMSLLGSLAFVAVAAVGGYLVFNDHITFGVIVSFLIYVQLFTNPLGEMAQAVMEMQSTVAASDRVFELLNTNEMENESKLAKASNEKIKGAVKFQNVKFSYQPNKPIIKDFTVNVKGGSKVAIVGPTGAGKTTLVNLLMKFYKVDDGDITIDGTSINEIRRGNVSNMFSMVLQDAWIFSGTIKENLLYNMKVDKKDEQEILDRAAEATGLDHFIKTLPSGYETVLDEKADISDGQKQLLTIARAMIKDAPLLILDEATSSVDTRTEVIVKTAMDKLARGRTSFVIAHRLSTIKNADLIIVMDKGDIVETGTHEGLLKKKGFYSELYNSQFAA